MKKMILVIALLVAVGCDEKRIVIVKDGIFGQTALLANNGLTVHHLGLDTLEVRLARTYAASINLLNANTVVIDLGRSDKNLGTPIARFSADYTALIGSLPTTDLYAGRRIVCVQRDPVYAPQGCPEVIQPNQLTALYESLYPPAG